MKLGERIWWAIFAIRRRHRRPDGRELDFSDIGRLVAERERRLDERGKVQPYKAAYVGRWQLAETGAENAREPYRRTIKALAELAGFPAGWLAFGEGEAPAIVKAAQPPVSSVRELPGVEGEIEPVTQPPRKRRVAGDERDEAPRVKTRVGKAARGRKKSR